MTNEALKIADELDEWYSIDCAKKACKVIRDLFNENEQLKHDISTLSQEHISMRARMERLESENQLLLDYKFRYESCAK